MKYRVSTTVITIALALGLSVSIGNADESVPHWGYTGHNTPDTWGKLSPKFRECGVGMNQSPIDIKDSLHVGLPPLTLEFKSASKNIINNGHTVQVNMESGSTFQIDGKTFELKQFHFHTPSENHINGKAFPMEAHFVTKDKEGDLAVVALMFEEGAKNSALEEAWKAMPTKEGETNPLALKEIAQKLLPEDKHYYRFNGSLTTPPCSEGVRWFVLKTPVTASKEQIEKFHHTMHHDNNRPVQPLNAREVIE